MLPGIAAIQGYRPQMLHLVEDVISERPLRWADNHNPALERKDSLLPHRRAPDSLRKDNGTHSHDIYLPAVVDREGIA